MKKKYLVIIVSVTLLLEILISFNFINNKKIYQNDVVKINELAKSIEINFKDKSKYPKNYNYTIVDKNDHVV